MMAELDIGVMATPRPQPSMQENANTAGVIPRAAGIGNDGAHQRDDGHGVETELSGGDQQQRDQQRHGQRRQRGDERCEAWTGSKLPTATPMNRRRRDGCLGADGWHRSRIAGAALQQTGQAELCRTGEAPGLDGEPAAAISGTTRVTPATTEMPYKTAVASENSMTSSIRPTIRLWIIHRLRVMGRVPPRVCRRAPERRSSSQPSAAMPTATTKAIGISKRIGAAGTAVDTTAVMMLIGLQQFITQKPR